MGLRSTDTRAAVVDGVRPPSTVDAHVALVTAEGCEKRSAQSASKFWY
tara:strand:+ start:165 stop:308 length:144 start_codon:yes stop_codon:yes gene_type:complete